MKEILKIRKDERTPAAIALVVILTLQYLIISKFWTLFACFSDKSWDVFMRNFHMSGFDPITYDVVTSWSQGYDAMRHPLLAIFMLPLYAVNKLLWMLTGANCVQLVVGAALVFCSFYSVIFMYRIMRDLIALKRKDAWMLAAFFFGFAYIAITMIVPDHFCFSLFVLLAVLHVAGMKMKRKETFSMEETAGLFVITAGITLSNGIVVFLAVLFVNGKSFWKRRFFVTAVVIPAILMFALAELLSLSCDRSKQDALSPVVSQMSWTSNQVSRADVMTENFFGESVQLHRRHVLGDVLFKRPVIVRYSWRIQYVAESIMLLLFLLGILEGRRRRYMWLLLSVFLFNFMLHIALGFAITEVYIMAAHWAFVIPLCIAYLFKTEEKTKFWIARIVIFMFTAYLWIYNGALLFRYLTWPLTK